MVLSQLPDTSDIPSGKKTRDVTRLVCPERTAILLPVTALRVMMSLEPKPTAIISFQHARACGEPCNEAVQKHGPHPTEGPLTTLTSCDSSVLWCWSQDEEGESWRAEE